MTANFLKRELKAQDRVQTVQAGGFSEVSSCMGSWVEYLGADHFGFCDLMPE